MSSWLQRVYAAKGLEAPDPLVEEPVVSEPSVDYSTLKVAELRELLEAQGLPTNGRKAELVNRLKENSEVSTDDEEEE